MVSLPRSTWERLIIWMGLGLAVYFFYGRRVRTRAPVADGQEAATG
jgi:APA family basic amino acid/polyamine antiporter